MTDLPPPFSANQPLPPPSGPVPTGYVPYGVAPVRSPQPSGGSVFGQLVWRIIVLSMAGGAVIGAGFVLVGALVQGDSDVASLGFAAMFVGTIFGLILGVPAGLVLGGIGAAMLVPYKGKSYTKWWARIGALIAVALFYTWLWWAISIDEGEYWLVAGLTAPGLLGAFFGSWFLVHWYTRRMGD
ncbi:MAG: hypothetical protein ABMA25_15050 [Ilumatobacteraceae bacterium]